MDIEKKEAVRLLLQGRQYVFSAQRSQTKGI